MSIYIRVDIGGDTSPPQKKKMKKDNEIDFKYKKLVGKHGENNLFGLLSAKSEWHRKPEEVT